MLIEQVSYEIDWRNFKPGTSFFVPCLNCSEAKKEVLMVTKRLKVEVLTKICIENGIRGLRIWKL
jgi:hypothetical protein